MKLVGKINIEIWDGDPEAPESNLKGSIEEFNDIHPDLPDAWDSSNFIDEWLSGKFKDNSYYDHPVTKERGRFLDAKNGNSLLFDVRLGTHNDIKKIKKGVIAGRDTSREQLRFDDGYSGYDLTGDYLYYTIEKFSNKQNFEGIYATNNSLKFTEKQIEALQADSYNSLSSSASTACLAIPLNEGAEYHYCVQYTSEKQFSPVNREFEIHNIGVYACWSSLNNNSTLYITPTNDSSSIGCTFHKFSKPIAVEKTDYIKIKYAIMVDVKHLVATPERFEVVNSEGNKVDSVKIPYMHIALPEINKAKNWLEDISGNPLKGLIPVNISKNVNTFLKNTFILSGCEGNACFGIGSTSPDIVTNNIVKSQGHTEYKEFEQTYFKSGMKNTVRNYYDKVLFNGGKLDDILEGYPIIYTRDFYGSEWLKQKVTYSTPPGLSRRLTSEQIQSTIHLPAKDDKNINRSYNWIMELPYAYDPRIDDYDHAFLAYMTVFKEPLVKTKFDEIKLTTNMLFAQTVKGFPFSSELSKSEEQE